jgi:uncharacterized PurR-regulated membrane protein YhhQ (DUF165 family)
MFKWIVALLYVISIMLGNFFIIWFGLFELDVFNYQFLIPAGAVWIGLTFSFRDLTQKCWGKNRVWYFMILSTIITGLFSGKVALASMCAFLLGESMDWFVYTVTKKDLKWRIIYSNLFSTPIDTAVFVTWIFGFNINAILCQFIIKYLSGLLTIPAIPWFERMYQKYNK